MTVIFRVFPSGIWKRVSLLLCVSLVCFGCDSRPLRFSLLTKTSGAPFWDAVHTGAYEGAQSCRASVRYNGPPREDSLREQLALFEMSLRDRYSGIILAPIEARAFRNPVQRAVSSGVPVVVLGEDLGIRLEGLSYVLSDERAAGMLAAETVGALLHGSGDIAITGILSDEPSNVLREQSFEETLKVRFRGIHVVRKVSGAMNLAEETEKAVELLSSAPSLRMMVALNATATRAAYYAKLGSERYRSVHLLGFDQDLLVPLFTGELDAVIGVRTREMGFRAAVALCDAIDGKPAPDVQIVHPMLITKETMRQADVMSETENMFWDPASE